jgi:hypothetical protein
MIVTEYTDATFEEFTEMCDNKFDEKTLTKVWKSLLRRKNMVVLGKTSNELDHCDPFVDVVQDFVSQKASPSHPPATSSQEPPNKTMSVPETSQEMSRKTQEKGDV